MIQSLDVFFSSPSDVGEERAAFAEQVRTLDRMPHVRSRYRLNALGYETDVPPVVGKPPQEIVDRYIQAAGSDIFVCVMWKKSGTPMVAPDGESYPSGTQYEFRQAYDATCERGAPVILLYRCARDPDIDAEPEVSAFFARFEGADARFKGLYQTYTTVEDFRERLFFDLDNILLKELRDPVRERTHSFFRHVSLPVRYVERRAVLDTISARLLAPEGRRVALWGMGGSGKSVLARALCERHDIASAFPDGVLLCSLGRDKPVEPWLHAWCQALQVSVPPAPAGVATLKAALARALADRTCLLVVDDVWSRRDLDAFRVDAERCRLLLTTRDAEIARSVDAERIEIPAMQRAEALDLLRAWADGHLDDADAGLTGAIVDHLHGLPLAIKLAGSKLSREDPATWLREFDVRELAESRPESKQDSLSWTFNESLGDLDPTTSELYQALAIFPETEAVPERVVARLWGELGGLREGAVRTLLHDLAARALLDFEPGDDGYTVGMHGLIQEFLRGGIADDDYRALHERLLCTYRDGAWSDVPDDGYLHDHLAQHLRESGNVAELQVLFADDRWMLASLRAHGYTYDAYLRDLQAAWDCAEESLSERSAWPFLFRLALIRTSINSIAGNYTRGIAARALKDGLWEAHHVLGAAARTAKPEDAFGLCHTLLESGGIHERDAQLALDGAFRAALAISYEPTRALALGVLAPRLDRPRLREAFRALFGFEDIGPAVDCCVWVMREFDPEDIDDLVADARRRGAPWQVGLVLGLAADENRHLLPELRTLWEQERDPLRRAFLIMLHASSLEPAQRRDQFAELMSLLPELRPLDSEAALVFLCRLELEEAEVDRFVESSAGAAHTMLLRKMPEERRGGMVDRLLDPTANEFARANAYRRLSAELKGERHRDAVADVLAMGDENAVAIGIGAVANEELDADQAQALFELATRIAREDLKCSAITSLVDRVDGPMRERAVQLIVTLAGTMLWGSDSVTDTAVPHLDDSQFRELLRQRGEIDDATRRALALEALARAVGGPESARIVECAVATRMAMPLTTQSDQRSWCFGVQDIAPLLTQSQIDQFLEMARTIRDDQCLAFALEPLAAVADEQRVDCILSLIETMQLSWAIARSISALAGRLQAEQLRDAVTLLNRLPSLDRAYGFLGLIDYFDADRRAGFVDTALVELKRAPSDWHKARLLDMLADNLSGDRWDRAIAVLHGINDRGERDSALRALAPRMGATRISAELEALAGLDDEAIVADAIKTLAPHLAEADVHQALALALGLRNDGYCEGALSALAPALTGDGLRRAYARAETMASDSMVDAMCNLLQRHPDEERTGIARRCVDAVERVTTPRAKEALAWLESVANGTELEEDAPPGLREFTDGTRTGLFGPECARRATDAGLDDASIVVLAESIVEISDRWRWT